ncbi:glutathione S-transferase family protein [Oceaniglobus roseus]|uniref:glutathione S-transferase family protein n=1 Tax=Oceaniglobus roseus TaxID=1737570 RepID=UPI000C7EA894|nr:glutathione S-transferase family protein [Kandeliimicrobium roseum]
MEEITEEITVWGRATSSNVQAVLWGLAEMGLPFRRIDAGGRFGGLDTPDYRAMNPPGLIPTVRIGDGPALFESAAILRALLARFGDPPFWPDGPDARAVIDMWAEWSKHTLAASFTVPVFWAHWRTPEAERDTAAIEKGLRRFERNLALFCDQCRGDWLLGDFSLADIWAGHVLYRYFTLDLDRRPPPGAEAYYDRLAARPAYGEHVMVDYSELKAVRRS